MYTRAFIFTAVVWTVLCLLLPLMSFLGISEETRQFYSNAIQITAPIAAALLCYRTGFSFEREDPMRKVWALVGSGVLAWGVGAILYASYQALNGGAEPPYPWYSDIGYLLMVPLVVVGMFIFQNALEVEIPIWGITAGSILFILTLIIGFYSSEQALTEAKNALEYNVEIAYVVLDPLLLGMTAMVASVLAGGAAALPWWYTLLGLVLYFIGNVAFNFQVANDTYVTGGLTDISWPLAFGLIGISALLTRAMFRVEGLTDFHALQSK